MKTITSISSTKADESGDVTFKILKILSSACVGCCDALHWSAFRDESHSQVLGVLPAKSPQLWAPTQITLADDSRICNLTAPYQSILHPMTFWHGGLRLSPLAPTWGNPKGSWISASELPLGSAEASTETASQLHFPSPPQVLILRAIPNKRFVC